VTATATNREGERTQPYYSIRKVDANINYIEYAAKTDTAILLGTSI